MNAILPAHVANTLVDPAAYADDRIFDAYRWMRDAMPVGKAICDGYDPFWAITRHADILAVSRDNATFSNARGQLILVTQASDRKIRERTGGSPHIGNSLIQMDGDEHRAYRKVTQSYFMPKNLRAREEHVRSIAKRTIDAMFATGGSCDFAADVAVHYPLRVVMEIIGVPEEDFPRILRLAQEVFAPQDPDVVRGQTSADADAHAAALLVSIGELRDYFVALTHDRRQTPRDDLASIIANSEIFGEPISDFHASGYFIILATAGHDTTSSSVATLMRALAERPGLLEELKADPALLPGFIEEGIRFGTPVKTFMRTATRDAEVGGQQIREGDWLMLCYASGNRDAAVFDDADSFDIRRPLNRQLAFGYGAHVCLGQHLAKIELDALFSELLPRLDWVRPNGPPAMIKSTFVNGLRALPIAFGGR